MSKPLEGQVFQSTEYPTTLEVIEVTATHFRYRSTTVVTNINGYQHEFSDTYLSVIQWFPNIINRGKYQELTDEQREHYRRVQQNS